MDKLIKNMVESICSSKDDPQGVNPDEVLQEIYNRGLMSSVLNLDSVHPNLFQSEHEIGKHQLTNNNAWEGGDGTTGWLEKLRNQSDGCNNDGENGELNFLHVSTCEFLICMKNISASRQAILFESGNLGRKMFFGSLVS